METSLVYCHDYAYINLSGMHLFRNLFDHIKILQIARFKNKQRTNSLPFPSYDNDD